jgi:hypothetical protein
VLSKAASDLSGAALSLAPAGTARGETASVSPPSPYPAIVPALAGRVARVTFTLSDPDLSESQLIEAGFTLEFQYLNGTSSAQSVEHRRIRPSAQRGDGSRV